MIDLNSYTNTLYVYHDVYKMKLYILCFAYICVGLFSKKTAWCRPMFWILTLAIGTNEYSEYLSLQEASTFSKAMIDTTSRLSFSVFIMGLFYSMFQHIRSYLSPNHTKVVLYTLFFIKFIIMTIECIKLFYHFSHLSCDWISPLVIWTGVSVLFFLFLGHLLLHVKTCKQWVQHKLSGCFIVFWVLCTYYTYTYFNEKCEMVSFQDPHLTPNTSYRINFFSWFILFAYTIWDRIVIMK